MVGAGVVEGECSDEEAVDVDRGVGVVVVDGEGLTFVLAAEVDLVAAVSDPGAAVVDGAVAALRGSGDRGGEI